MARAELLTDPGVLRPVRTCEFQSCSAVGQVGGCAVLPWRFAWQRCRAAGVEAVSEVEQLAGERFGQVVVHVQKSRPGTWQDLVNAWRLLAPEGELLLFGTNALGVRSAVKRLARELDQTPELLANRAHGRVVRFRREDGPGPAAPPALTVEVPIGLVAGAEPLRLHSAPGLFSADRLDPGTEQLLEHLSSVEPGAALLDLGCGVGPLGLVALGRWPAARAVLADADARAVGCARTNVAQLGLSDRCAVVWWDASEAPPATDCDRVLLNPPFHRGKAVDLELARSLFATAAASLRRGGIALVVANRALPYEAELARHGEVREVRRGGGYKILRLTKP